MRYFLDWRDYTKQPHVKQLIESKGLEFVRQQYLREVNKVMWDDPMMIKEGFSDISVPGSAVSTAGVGTATRVITGSVREISRYTWASNVTNAITGSFTSSLNGSYIEITGYTGGSDYSYNYVNTMKRFRLYLVSSSADFAVSNMTGISGVITASYTDITETVNITGSLLIKWRDAINTQTATAVVGGFANTVAPSTLFSASIGDGSGSITFNNLFAGSVTNISTNISALTGSVATVVNGLDVFYQDINSTSFDATFPPYNNMTRRG
jgi:hypothetical protein